ncbi:MAG: carboxylesterase family protein [Bacteroidales bacterium]|nr:carboxylesterase family protein [Bacteroidales bacterium]
MKRIIISVIAAAFACALQCWGQEPVILPSSTHLYAHRDTCDLFLDIYEPAEGSQTSIDGKQKPSILFVFGGGFMGGSRSEGYVLPYYKAMTENGFRIIAIDYRLGLKGLKSGLDLSFPGKLDRAIAAATEDLYSATIWLIEQGREHGIDPDNIVLCGSSAGAITVLHAEWELCNRSERAQVIPSFFNFAGVMSFSGAIFSHVGDIKYEKEPCPHLLLHGTVDRLVDYRQIWFFNHRFAGTDVLTKSLKKGGYNYNTIRFDGYGHEIAGSMAKTVPLQIEFITGNIMNGNRNIVDATVSSPDIEPIGMGKNGPGSLYHRKKK